MDGAARQRLVAFLDAHALVEDPDATADRFAAFLVSLRRANRAMNLIGRLDDGAVVDQLFCDSLAPLTLGVALAGPVLDIGTGPGLPGIPWALVAPEREVVLLEPRDRRYRYLGMAMRELRLDRVRRVRGRIDSPTDLDALGIDRPATVVSKAVMPPVRWIELAATLVGPGGHVVAMTAADEAKATQRAAAEAGLTLAGERVFEWSGAVPRWSAAFAAPA